VTKYKADPPKTVEDVTKFIDGVLNGDIDPYTKSEEPPAI
jgi:hypothetical protein